MTPQFYKDLEDTVFVLRNRIETLQTIIVGLCMVIGFIAGYIFLW